MRAQIQMDGRSVVKQTPQHIRLHIDTDYGITEMRRDEGPHKRSCHRKLGPFLTNPIDTVQNEGYRS